MKRISLNIVVAVVLMLMAGQLIGQAEFEPLAVCEGAQEFYDVVSGEMGERFLDVMEEAYTNIQTQQSRDFVSNITTAESIVEEMRSLDAPDCARWAQERFALSSEALISAWYSFAEGNQNDFIANFAQSRFYSGEGRGYLVAYGVQVRDLEAEAEAED